MTGYCPAPVRGGQEWQFSVHLGVKDCGLTVRWQPRRQSWRSLLQNVRSNAVSASDVSNSLKLLQVVCLLGGKPTDDRCIIQ